MPAHSVFFRLHFPALKLTDTDLHSGQLTDQPPCVIENPPA